MKSIPIIFIVLILAISPVSACSSVIGVDSFGFQRDSVEPADILIQNVDGALVESKVGFVHSVVFQDGDAFGIGGADSNLCNNIIVGIGYAAHMFNIPQLIYLAAPFTWYTGGHFAYKDGNTAYYMTFVNGIAIGTSQLTMGQYLIVSNDAICTGTYRASDTFTALSQSTFAAGHHRYAIEYQQGGFVIQNFQNESITI